MALFLNGIPVATAELKNPADGSDRRRTRSGSTARPRPEGADLRPSYPRPLRGRPDLAFMTTRLAGTRTRFLPFNTGSDGPGQTGGAGNPPAKYRAVPHVLPLGAGLAAGRVAGPAPALPARRGPR